MHGRPGAVQTRDGRTWRCAALPPARTCTSRCPLWSPAIHRSKSNPHSFSSPSYRIDLNGISISTTYPHGWMLERANHTPSQLPSRLRPSSIRRESNCVPEALTPNLYADARSLNVSSISDTPSPLDWSWMPAWSWMGACVLIADDQRIERLIGGEHLRHGAFRWRLAVERSESVRSRRLESASAHTGSISPSMRGATVAVCRIMVFGCWRLRTRKHGQHSTREKNEQETSNGSEGA